MFQVKYKSAVLNTYDNFEDATVDAETRILENNVSSVYVYDVENDERWDKEDWENINPEWNEHLK